MIWMRMARLEKPGSIANRLMCAGAIELIVLAALRPIADYLIILKSLLRFKSRSGEQKRAGPEYDTDSDASNEETTEGYSVEDDTEGYSED